MIRDTHYNLTLSIDTATHVQTLGLLRGKEVVEHLQTRVRYNHGQALLPNIRSRLETHDIDPADLDLISVGIGPGAFTGLRVGMAIAKSFARATETPLVGISTLAAVAYPVAYSAPNQLVVPMYDARRSEVFTGAYEWNDEQLDEIREDRTASPEEAKEMLEQLSQSRKTVTVVGNGPDYYEDILDPSVSGLRYTAGWTHPPSGLAFAELGRQKAVAEGTDDLEALEPNYIRPSDAELND